MFEYLKNLELPGFDLANWTSSLRHHVNVHPDYYDIEDSRDRSALSDIEYADTNGVLTDWLIEHGHLQAALWENECPYYHIEVKATTSYNWNEPFYISKNQERYVSSEAIVSRSV